jgi:hypothetical protein
VVSRRRVVHPGSSVGIGLAAWHCDLFR